MNKLKIDEEFKKLLRPLTDKEFSKLEADCIENGITDAILVWHDVIIDGHNRYEIAQKHGLEFRTQEKEFPNRDHAILYIVKHQLARRNLTVLDRIELASMIRPTIERLAAEKQKATQAPPGVKIGQHVQGVIHVDKAFASTESSIQDGGISDGTSDGVPAFVSQVPVERSKDDEGTFGQTFVTGSIPKAMEKIQVQKEIANLAEVGTGTVARYDIIKANKPEAIEKIREGEATLGGEYKKIVAEGKKEEEKARLEVVAEKTKGLDLGVEISSHLYSGSALKTQVVVTMFDPGLRYLARNILSNSKYYVIISKTREAYKVPDLVSPNMPFVNIIVMDADNGVFLAHVFGDRSKNLAEIVRGSFEEGLTEILTSLVDEGSDVANPYPVDGKIAKAIKSAKMIGHIFTGGNKNVETRVRTDLT